MQSSECEFVFAHLGAASAGARALHDRLRPVLATLPSARVVASFMGLFGFGNHELFVLLAFAAGRNGAAALRACLPDDVQVLALRALRATVRPIDDAAFTRSGIYVLREFQVAAADVDEVVLLSRTAWASFETSADYRSEPMALFAPLASASPEVALDPPARAAPMLLITWYDNLNSWERSRTPHPDAAANFARRAALTRRTIAYCMRLVD